MFVTMLDWQSLPNSLIDDNLESILKLKDCSPFPDYENFRQYKIENKDLLDLIQKNFSFDVYNNTYYQVIKNDLPIHVDIRKSAFNYIINAGGNEVYTVFYDDNENELFKINLPKYKWHCLDVSKPHNVRGITGTRIAVTVFE
jgi:hypothetical protein